MSDKPDRKMNKRMFYLWDENVTAYEMIENKSEFINKAIKKYMDNMNQVPEVTGDPRIDYVRNAVKNL